MKRKKKISILEERKSEKEVKGNKEEENEGEKLKIKQLKIIIRKKNVQKEENKLWLGKNVEDAWRRKIMKNYFSCVT